jgi:hypothetical protein
MKSIVTRELLEAAFLRQKTMSHLRLGDALVQEKLITTAQRDAALAVQAHDPRKLLGEILVATWVVTREEIRRVLVEQLGVPAVDIAKFPCEPDAVAAISSYLARRYKVMPLFRTATRIAIAMENPLWWDALRELEAFTRLRVDRAMAPREDLRAAILRNYDAIAHSAPHPPPPRDADIRPVPAMLPKGAT